MRGGFWSKAWFRPLFTLVLLTANVAAPFRTDSLVRVILSGPWQRVGSAPVVRVRAVTPGGLFQGFRAVVGLTRRGGDTAPGAGSTPVTLLSRIPPRRVACTRGGRVSLPLCSPLRC